MPLTPADITQITNLFTTLLADARVKISELPAAGSLSRSAVAPFVDSGATVKASIADLLALGGTVVLTGQDLRAMNTDTLQDNTLFTDLGVGTPGDGGGGQWIYDADSVAQDNTGTVIAPDTGVGRFLRLFSGAIDARWFEAGMGGDDAIPLQRAINVAMEDGFSLYIPAGNYASTVQLNVTDPCRIFGDGFTSIITVSQNNANAINVSAAEGVQIDHLFVKHTGTTNSGSVGYAIAFTNGSNKGIADDVRTEGKRGGVLIENTNDCLVTDHYNTFADSASQDSAGVAIKYSSSRNTVALNKLFGGGWHGVLVQTIASGNHCDDNIVNACQIADAHAYGVAFYIAVSGSFAERNIASSNNIRNILGDVNAGSGVVFGAGIYVQGAEWSNIVGNTISKTNVSTVTELLAPGAIGLANVSCATVTGNMIHDARWYGIYVNDANDEGNGLGSIVISGGEISVPTKDGIKVSRANNVTISNVDITNGLASGIIIINVVGFPKRGHVITGGTIKGCASQCIQADYANGILITGVKGENYGNYGVYLEHCDGITLNGNRMHGTAAGKVAYGLISTSSNISFLNNSASGGGAGSIGVLDEVGALYGTGNRITGHTTLFSGAGGVERTLGTGATPTVKDGDGIQYIVAAGATAVTNLTDGAPDQRVTLRFTGARTINNGAGILLNGAANFVGADANTLSLMFSVALAGWIETGRKV